MTTCPTCKSDEDLVIARKDGAPGYSCAKCGGWVAAGGGAVAKVAGGAPRNARGSSQDPAVLDALLAGVAALGGTATTADLRPVFVAANPDLAEESLRFHLVHLCDSARPPQLERPFGPVDQRGQSARRRAWLHQHRPDQASHDTQVWRLAMTAKRSHLDAAAEAGRQPAEEDVAKRLTTDLLHHATEVVPEAIGHRSPALVQLLDGGGSEALARVTAAYRHQPSDGFKAIVESRRPDLTVEAFLLAHADAEVLVPFIDLRWARSRLATAGYDAPGDLGR